MASGADLLKPAGAALPPMSSSQSSTAYDFAVSRGYDGSPSDLMGLKRFLASQADWGSDADFEQLHQYGLSQGVDLFPQATAAQSRPKPSHVAPSTGGIDPSDGDQEGWNTPTLGEDAALGGSGRYLYPEERNQPAVSDSASPYSLTPADGGNHRYDYMDSFDLPGGGNGPKFDRGQFHDHEQRQLLEMIERHERGNPGFLQRLMDMFR